MSDAGARIERSLLELVHALYAETAARDDIHLSLSAEHFVAVCRELQDRACYQRVVGAYGYVEESMHRRVVLNGPGARIVITRQGDTDAG